MELREVKQRFFAMRNGLLGDSLRKQCSLPHKLIFGLNIPQLKEIAAECGKDASLAEALWADSGCRESRLLAPMICPDFRPQWLEETLSPEEADIICHSMLRRMEGAAALAITLASSPEPLVRYGAVRLILNLLPGAIDEARRLAAVIPPHPLTRAVMTQLADEIDFLSE